jgi:hypothetical protein
MYLEFAQDKQSVAVELEQDKQVESQEEHVLLEVFPYFPTGQDVTQEILFKKYGDMHEVH